MAIFGYTAYSGSKFAVTGFSEALRQEVKKHGIHVSVIFPADVDTPQLHAENEIKPFETKDLAGNITLMQPDDIAPGILETIARRRHSFTPGFENKFVLFMERHFRGLVRLIVDRMLVSITRRGPKAA